MSSSRLLRAGFALAVGTATVVPAVAAVQAQGPTATIVVYFDLDNDSRRDPNEPGVPGQALHSANGVITDAAGRAEIELKDNGPGQTASVRLSSGWFRSDCTEVDCDPVTSGNRQNDFSVRNQFVKLFGAEDGGTYHVGIVPDWPGGYDEMPSRFGWADDGNGLLDPGEATGPINAVDVSTRLSWHVPSSSECNRTGNAAHRSCRPGDSPRFQFQVMNEGTVELSGVSGFLDMPFDAEITAKESVRPYNQPGLGLTFGEYDPDAGGYPWTIEGTMGIGAVAQFVISTTVPDVVRQTPRPSKWDHVLVNRVTAVDQWNGSNDADSAQCSTGPAPSCEATVGKHDKQSPSADDFDDIAFSVVGVPAADRIGTVYDLALVHRSMTGGPVEPGDMVAFEIEVINQGTRHVRNTEVVLHPPTGLTFSAGDNPAWTAEGTTVLQGQLAAGGTGSISVNLRVDASAIAAMNGTSDLRSLAEVAHVLDSESATFVPADVDSLPDADPSNDGYDVADPWDAAGDDVTTRDGSTVGTSAGGEDDQDPAAVLIADGAADEPAPPACSGVRAMSQVTLYFTGDLGTNAHLIRDGSWIAAVAGLTTLIDSEAPVDATYALRVRDGGVVTDYGCDIEVAPPPGPMCVGARAGATVSLSFSGDLGMNANLLRDDDWLATVTGLSTFVDASDPASVYVLRVRNAGTTTDVACAII